MDKGKFSLSLNISEEELKEQNEYILRLNKLLPGLYSVSSPKAFVHTYGCQGNVSDSERIKGMLFEMGYEFTDDQEDADLILFNTCAIREHAQDRVFGNVGRLKALKQCKPNLIIALCGCMVQQEHVIEKIKKSYSFVDIIFGTHVIHKLPELLFKALSHSKRIFDTTEGINGIAEGFDVYRDNGIKAFVPIMYGCDNFCSYCIVPYVKGRERSRRSSEIILEARGLIEKGYKDITLLGQNVNSYGKGLDEDIDFAGLLRKINDIPGEFTIRFMTSHPKDCSFELLDTMASCDKVARHLHLPVQSGNDRVLREMNRKYNREKYLSLVEYAKKVMPDISLTSDIIVGFPGETYEEFCDTLSLVEEVEYTSLFTFIYSPRVSTAAAKMPDPVSHKEKTVWFKELTDLQESIAARRTAAMKGKVFRVLAEGFGKNNDDTVLGRTSGNVIIEFKADKDIIGKFCFVKVTDPLTWILRGELIKNNEV